MSVEKEYKRLRNIVVVLGLSFLFVLVCLAFWGSYQVKYFNDRLIAQRESLEGKIPSVKDGSTPIKGLDYSDGNDGQDGRDGRDGRDGTDSISTISLQPIYTNVPVPGAQGEKGEKGDTGEQGERGLPGRTVYQRYNILTLQEECRYAGDVQWQPVSECQ